MLAIVEYLATHNFLGEVDEDPSPSSRRVLLVTWAMIIVGSICIFGGLIFIGLLMEWP